MRSLILSWLRKPDAVVKITGTDERGFTATEEIRVPQYRLGRFGSWLHLKLSKRRARYIKGIEVKDD